MMILKYSKNNDKMSSPQHCTNCNKVPKNIFSLSCDHPLCLGCAVSLTIRENYIYIIVCSSCEEETSFEQPLFAELLRQLSESKGRDEKENEKENRFTLNQPEQKDQGKKPSSVDRYCQEHKDHELAYVCKSCRNALVCPECVINGIHKHHEVTTVQQEGKHIKATLEHQLSSLTHKKADLKHLQSTRLTAIQQRKHELENLRIHVKQQYNEIKEQLCQEEASILERCEELIEIHREEQQHFEGQISSQIESIQTKRSEIAHILDPIVEENKGMSSRAHFKLQTIQLIAQYNIIVSELNKKVVPEKEYTSNDRQVAAEVENLFRKLQEKRRPSFQYRAPQLERKEQFPVRIDSNIPIYSKNLREPEKRKPSDYFQLV